MYRIGHGTYMYYDFSKGCVCMYVRMLHCVLWVGVVGVCHALIRR